MSAPLVWIGLPALLAVGLAFIRQRERLATLTGAVAAALLGLFAWLAPASGVIRLGPLTLELEESIAFLGRRFVLEGADHPILALIYLGLAFWLFGALAANPGSLFVPLALAVTAILTAALAVEPFLYAGLLILMAVLVSIPMLLPPGRQVGKGVMRYLTFQTLGMPFLLFTGWLLEGVEAGAGAAEVSASVGLLTGLGFAFLLAIFPFHTWIPMLAEENHPYVSAFIFFLLPLSVLLFALGFLEQYPWLQSASGIYTYLSLTGALMTLTGGVWAAFQRHLGRLLGFAAAFEIGISLLALSLAVGPGRADLGLFFATLLPRGIGLAAVALAIVKIQEHYPDPLLSQVQGAARRLPLASTALVTALLALTGFPLLAGFPVRVALWQGLARQFPLALILALTGSAGLLLGSLRVLVGLLMGPQEGPWRFSEGGLARVLLGVGILFLIVAGLLPQVFLPWFTAMGAAFPSFGP